MSVKVSRIIVKIGEYELDLTIEDAEQLRTILNDILGKKEEKEDFFNELRKIGDSIAPKEIHHHHPYIWYDPPTTTPEYKPYEIYVGDPPPGQFTTGGTSSKSSDVLSSESVTLTNGSDLTTNGSDLTVAGQGDCSTLYCMVNK